MMTQTTKAPKALNGILWAVQILLAATLIWAAITKLSKPAAELAVMWPWTAGNRGLVTFTGIMDLLAGLGLLLPGLLRMAPKLTVYAAFGTIALMIAASVFHISRGEGPQIGINIVVALLATVVAWGRLKRTPLKAGRAQA